MNVFGRSVISGEMKCDRELFHWATGWTGAAYFILYLLAKRYEPTGGEILWDLVIQTDKHVVASLGTGNSDYGSDYECLSNMNKVEYEKHNNVKEGLVNKCSLWW